MYTKSGSKEELREKLIIQSENPTYRKMAKKTIVEGVWDDHDYAKNDAGKSIFSAKERQFRQSEYLKFLNVKSSNEERYYMRDGLYSSHLFRSSNGNVRVIFLDTRSQRDDHMIPSIAIHHWIPLSALIAAIGRWICASFGIGIEYDGDVLGENQWKWFENELKESEGNDSSVIVVSSIQMFTSNPIVESWSHFPKSRDRFVNLIRTYTPSGLLILSGDVHHAEMISDPCKNNILEVTSSGLTHTCTTPWFGFFCPWYETFDLLCLHTHTCKIRTKTNTG